MDNKSKFGTILVIAFIAFAIFVIPVNSDGAVGVVDKSRYVSVIENTDQCLVDCYTIYKVSGFNQAVDLTSTFDLKFRKPDTNLISYKQTDYVNQKKIEILFPRTRTETYITQEYYECTYESKDNITGKPIKLPTLCTKNITNTRTINYNQSYSLDEWGAVAQGGSVLLKVSGKKGLFASVDNVLCLNLEGKETCFMEYAWWDSDWLYKYPINIVATNGSHTNEPIILNVSGAACGANGNNSLRVILNDSIAVPFQFDSNNQQIVFIANVSGITNPNTDYSLYCNNAGAGAGDTATLFTLINTFNNQSVANLKERYWGPAQSNTTTNAQSKEGYSWRMQTDATNSRLAGIPIPSTTGVNYYFSFDLKDDTPSTVGSTQISTEARNIIFKMDSKGTTPTLNAVDWGNGGDYLGFSYATGKWMTVNANYLTASSKSNINISDYTGLLCSNNSLAAVAATAVTAFEIQNLGATIDYYIDRVFLSTSEFALYPVVYNASLGTLQTNTGSSTITVTVTTPDNLNQTSKLPQINFSFVSNNTNRATEYATLWMNSTNLTGGLKANNTATYLIPPAALSAGNHSYQIQVNESNSTARSIWIFQPRFIINGSYLNLSIPQDQTIFTATITSGSISHSETTTNQTAILLKDDLNQSPVTIVLNASNRSTTTYSITNNATDTSFLNLGMPDSFLRIHILDEQSPTYNLTPFNITISVGGNTHTWTNQPNELTFENEYGLLGDLTLQYYINNSYPIRSMTFNHDGTQQHNLTLYLLSSTSGIYVRFNIRDCTQASVPNAIVTAQKYIGGAWTSVEAETSDAAGTATLFLDTSVTYQININVSGTSTTYSIRPTNSDYTLATGCGGTAVDSIIYPITYAFAPTGKLLPVNSTATTFNTTAIFNFNTTISTGGNPLDYYGVTAVYQNGTTLFTTNRSGNGGQINAYFNIQDARAGNYLNVTLFYAYPSKAPSYKYKMYYLTNSTAGSYSILGLFANALSVGKTGMTSAGAGITALIITGLLIIFIAGTTNSSLFAGVVGISVLGIFTYAGWFNPKIYLILAMVGGCVVILRNYR